MLIELHLLQNFAPANLNRDDTGAPKDCEFGGYRRARISSQCLKRAVRTHFKNEGILPKANLGDRTKRLVDGLRERLVARGRANDQSLAVAETIVRGVGLKVAEGKTEYLLFLAHDEIDRLAGICDNYWDVLTAAGGPTGPAKSAKDAKKAGREAVPAEVKKALETVLDGGRAADLALFGRMLADLPDKNVDAACQVAHALSTNKVSVEFDFYTAVDDLKPHDTAGADMLGTVEFNSACFYRYANVNAKQLLDNLGGDEELARSALRAFLQASVEAIPTGKQNSMAAQNPPSFVLAVLRERGLWSLANAFVEPIGPTGGGLVRNSIAALDDYWGKLTKMYGDRGIVGSWVSTLDDDGLTNLAGPRVVPIDQLFDQLVGAVRFGGPAAAGTR